MCNQAVCLVAAELERRGISTVVIQLLKLITERLRPPRALCVPFPHGFPLGQPNNPELQKKVILAALGLLERDDASPPLIVDYSE
jgi:hypothetical protein